jgi:HD-GYP domain-containing protein (c-di-GMP phosphodiesterase class II)
VIDEVRTLEPQLKQILYGCVEHVQATKAALYLSATRDLNEKRYELVTSYQYNAADRKSVNANDDLVDRLVVKRSAFFVNGLGADARLAEMLFRQGTDRLLVAPLFSRGRLIGFIDMRDKAGKKPFEGTDVEAARKIADEMLSLLSAKRLFDVAPIALVEPETAKPAFRANPAPAADVVTPRGELSQAAQNAIQSAREIMSKRQLVHQAARRVLSDHDLEVVRLLLPAALAIPGAVLACISAMGHLNNPQSIATLASVSDDAMEMLQTHLQQWLARSGQAQLATKPQIIYPFGVQVVPVTAAGISSILSVPLSAQVVDGLVLTVAFERTAEAQAQRALHIFLKQIEQSVESAIAAGSGRNDRQILAEKLLEPDFQKYPELVEHCRQTAVLAQRLAIALELPPAQVETIRIAALVHDVGLRLIDYDRLYGRQNLTPEEMRGMAEHPIVGAALVEPLLGNDVAQAVLRHHERVDGKGYPSHLTGNQIPLASRIIQICDAWVAMTSTRSYQAPMPFDEAAKRIRALAGTQFDAVLAEKFVSALAQIGA